MKKIKITKPGLFILRIVKEILKMIEWHIIRKADSLLGVEAQETTTSPLPLVKGVSWYVYELDGVQLRIGLKLRPHKNVFYVATGNITNRNFLKHRKEIDNGTYPLRTLHSKLRMIKHYEQGGTAPVPKPLSTRIDSYIREIFTISNDRTTPPADDPKKECSSVFGARAYFTLGYLFFAATYLFAVFSGYLDTLIPSILSILFFFILGEITKVENSGNWKKRTYFYFMRKRRVWQDLSFFVLMCTTVVSGFSLGHKYGLFSILFIFLVWLFFVIRAGILRRKIHA